MYLDWFDTFIAGLHSERLGDWERYVKSIKETTSFHAASGRRNYTKCTAWYLQEIDNLDEHTLRLLEASFVIRRKNVS